MWAICSGQLNIRQLFLPGNYPAPLSISTKDGSDEHDSVTGATGKNGLEIIQAFGWQTRTHRAMVRKQRRSRISRPSSNAGIR